jgi:hypothetical protein
LAPNFCHGNTTVVYSLGKGEGVGSIPTRGSKFMSEEQQKQQPAELNGCCALELTFPKKEEKSEQHVEEHINGVCCE